MPPPLTTILKSAQSMHATETLQVTGDDIRHIHYGMMVAEFEHAATRMRSSVC